eukprot:735890_1
MSENTAESDEQELPLPTRSSASFYANMLDGMDEFSVPPPSSRGLKTSPKHSSHGSRFPGAREVKQSEQDISGEKSAESSASVSASGEGSQGSASASASVSSHSRSDSGVSNGSGTGVSRRSGLPPKSQRRKRKTKPGIVDKDKPWKQKRREGSRKSELDFVLVTDKENQPRHQSTASAPVSEGSGSGVSHGSGSVPMDVDGSRLSVPHSEHGSDDFSLNTSDMSRRTSELLGRFGGSDFSDHAASDFSNRSMPASVSNSRAASESHSRRPSSGSVSSRRTSASDGSSSLGTHEAPTCPEDEPDKKKARISEELSVSEQAASVSEQAVSVSDQAASVSEQAVSVSEEELPSRSSVSIYEQAIAGMDEHSVPDFSSKRPGGGFPGAKSGYSFSPDSPPVSPKKSATESRPSQNNSIAEPANSHQSSVAESVQSRQSEPVASRKSSGAKPTKSRRNRSGAQPSKPWQSSKIESAKPNQTSESPAEQSAPTAELPTFDENSVPPSPSSNGGELPGVGGAYNFDAFDENSMPPPSSSGGEFPGARGGGYNFDEAFDEHSMPPPSNSGGGFPGAKADRGDPVTGVVEVSVPSTQEPRSEVSDVRETEVPVAKSDERPISSTKPSGSVPGASGANSDPQFDEKSMPPPSKPSGRFPGANGGDAVSQYDENSAPPPSKSGGEFPGASSGGYNFDKIDEHSVPPPSNSGSGGFPGANAGGFPGASSGGYNFEDKFDENSAPPPSKTGGEFPGASSGGYNLRWFSRCELWWLQL